MDKMIAYCGLDCSGCDAYKATINNDDNLRRKTAKLWSEMNGVEITADMINCEGCRADGVKTPFCNSLCPIRGCAIQKGCATCGDCEKVDGCLTVGMVHNTNAEAKMRLKNNGGKD